MPAYDPSNVFAKILRGELPAHKLYEDDDTLAFMDIMPRGDGHCLVIPKAPSRNILDVAPDSLAAVAATTWGRVRCGDSVSDMAAGAITDHWPAW